MDEFELANKYLDEGDGPRAMALFHALADQGRVDAMHSIAHSHLYGIAVPRDYDIAFKWFTRAAAGGCPQAMYHLGLCNAEGYGTPRNPKLALRWYKESAGLGDEDAEYRVGLCLERDGDAGEAVEWYRLAASHGQPEARERLRELGLDR